jgi:hypothetical protein
MNRGNWLKVFIPYETTALMTGTLQNHCGEILKMMKLETGNNLIDIEAFTMQNISIRIDTPFETILKELNLE